LKEQPQAQDRQEVEKRIEALTSVVPAAAAPVQNPPLEPEEGKKPAPVAKVEPAAKSAAPESQSGAVAVQVQPPSRLRTAAWVSVAAAVALATAGAILGLGAQNRADELQRRTTVLVNNQPPVYDDNQRQAYESLISEGNAYNTAAIALLSVAGAAAVTSTALFIADWVKRPKSERYRLASSPRPSMVLSGEGVRLFLGGSF
jgi:hypothetical protein